MRCTPSAPSTLCRRILGLLAMVLVWSGPLVDSALAQPEFLGNETTLLVNPNLTSTLATLAIDDGFLVATGQGFQGDLELQLLELDADGLPMATLGTVPSSAPFEAFLLDDGDGGALLVWREFLLSSPYRMAVRHFPKEGEPGEAFELTEEPFQLLNRGDFQVAFST